MNMFHFGLSFLCLLLTTVIVAQSDELSESTPQPINGLFANREMDTRLRIAYPPLREADIMYQTTVERVIDSREKLNLPFRHPEKGFFVSLLTGIEAGEIVLYDPAYPDFSQ
ncbi:MAG: hypothetical protein AAFU03_06285, partial [Bacteroidota bacterium]